MKAVVMAGGEGTRLRPLTLNRPKPLVPLGNKPIMQYILELLKKHNINEIIVTLHYLADEIVSFFGDGSDYGIKIVYSIEEEPLGTAGSIKKIERYLNEPFIIISGDALTDFDLTKVINFHKEKKALITLTLTKVENPLEYGVVIIDEEQKIKRFLEKPSWGEIFSDTINTGIYVLEPVVLKYIESGKVYDFSKDLFPSLLEKGLPLYGCVTGGYWCDIGNLKQYRQAHYDILAGKVNVEFKGKKLENNIWIGEGTEIHPSVKLQGPIIIGKNCRIKENSLIKEFSSIGENCILEEGTNVNRGIIWDNVYIGKKSQLTECIVCKGNTIKAYSIIFEGAVLGDHCLIGQGSIIQPQIKIWPGKNIEDGANVSMSLIWGGKWPGSLFGVNGIQGLANIEITPEFALKLGAAYGAFMEKSSIVITSRGAHPSSRMLNRAIICGLISVGVNVYDLRVIPSPISSYTIRNSEAKGGIHTAISSADSKISLVQFFNKVGINIDKTMERKIENIFFREDFRRTIMDEIGTIDFPARAVERYIQGYFNNLDVEIIKKLNCKVIIDYAFGSSSLVLPLILGKLGCETVTINAYLDPFKEREAQEDKEKALKQLSNIVLTLGANLGVLIDADAQSLILVDEKGWIIKDSELLALLSKLFLSNSSHIKGNNMLAVTLTAPSIIDKFAKEYNYKIIRTKLDSRYLMQLSALTEKKLLFSGDIEGRFIFPSFQPVFDAMFTFAKILEFMARSRQKLSELRETLPSFKILAKKVECLWQQKGKIMRRLIELNKNNKIEMLDGIKINLKDDWIAIIPDQIEPCIHLYAESSSYEKANQIIEEYIYKINNLKKGESLVEAKIKEKIREIFQTLPEELAFYFCSPSGYLGIKALSLEEFKEIIKSISLDSLDFHIQRGDFSRWLEYGLGEIQLAEKIKAADKFQGENLRKYLINIFKKYPEEMI